MFDRSLIRTGVASLALLAVIGTTVTPAQAAPTPGQAPETLVDPLTVSIEDLAEGLPSAELTVPDPQLPAGDFDSASPSTFVAAPVRATGERTEVPPEPAFDEDTSAVVDRGEFTTTFDNVDGTSTVSISAVPQNVLEEGDWVPIETDLSKVEGEWAVERHPLQPSFGGSATDEDVFQVARGDYSVSFTLEGASGSVGRQPTLRRQDLPRNVLVYNDVMAGVDLVYEVAPDRVKEVLVLEALPAPGETTWTWTVDAPGLSLVKGEFGDIDLVDAQGEVQFYIPSPVMWDSSGVEGVQEPVQHPVDAAIVENVDGTWSLTLSADRDWLADEAIEYPVHVDPTVYLPLGESEPRSYKSDGTVATGTIRVGNSRDGGVNRYWRGIARYAYEYAYDKQVIQAVMLGLYDGDGTVSCFTGQLRHATAFSYSGFGDRD